MHEQAARPALIKVLAEQIAAARKTANQEITSGWRPGDRAAAVLPDGSEIGSVTLAKGATKADVTDEAAFLEWVAEVYPEQIETVTVTRVRPAFVKAITDAAKKEGRPYDKPSGMDVPGVTVSQGDPYPKVTLAKDAAEVVARVWRSGGLAELVGGLLALEGGEG